MKSKFIGFPGALLMLSILLLTSCNGTITVKVVDEETGEPIEGAVVMVEWTITKGIGLTHTDSYKVVEVVTDKEGKAEMSGVYNPFADLSSVAVYKKGYVLWSNNDVFKGSRMLTNFEWKNNYTFKLNRFKPEYSYIEHTSFISRSTGTAHGDKKLLDEAYYWEELEASKERDKRRRQQ
ncbi:MAG TPA: carboxypeptidase regulatory-like domain-containing protein [Nitrospirae bacterium]|nr:carboxypeptidase regulatory-like domain-containing protein [Nitrospirota bacterium]